MSSFIIRRAGDPMKKFKTIDIVVVSLATALMCVCSWIQIPSAIPFTLQTFAVFFIALVLGARKGLAATLIYILLGIVGLPVFSGFQSGIGALLGATGGFVMGFVLSVMIVGLSADRKGLSLPFVIIGLTVGLAVCYVTGTLWYAFVYGDGNILGAMAVCVVPFIIPDIIKVILALIIAKKVSPIIRKLSTER